MSFFDTVHAWTFDEHYVPIPMQRRYREDWNRGRLNCRMALRQAKRFVLDDDFVRQVVRRATVQAPKMLQLCHLANLPFDKVWIEFNNEARIDAQAEQGTGHPRNGEKRGISAFFLERIKPDDPSRYVISHAGELSLGPDGITENNKMPFAPCSYLIDLTGMISIKAVERYEGPEQDGWAIMENLHAKLAGMGWGYFHEVEGGLEYASSAELNRRGAVTVENRFFRPLVDEIFSMDSDKGGEMIARHYTADVVEGRGNLRFVIAMLAMINCVPIQYRHRPAKGYQRARLRNVPYLDSHELTIHCGRRKIVNVVDDAISDAHSGRHHAKHAVRGFWRVAEYKLGGPVCSHEPVERDGAYALCGKCQKLLVWIDHHERGDASLGFIDHTYKVRP